MSGFSLGFLVEALVSSLLVITIGYCILVNRKLDSLRSDKSELRTIIRDLYAATGHAEQAIGTFRQNAESLEAHLGEQVVRAQNAGSRLSKDIERGEALLSKLAVISQPGPARTRPASAGTPPADRNRRRAEEGAAPPKRPAVLRHSELGLGLLNARQRTGSGNPPGAKEVA
jgi:hypothetical protein